MFTDWLCDGDNDCRDNSDELQCSKNIEHRISLIKKDSFFSFAFLFLFRSTSYYPVTAFSTDAFAPTPITLIAHIKTAWDIYLSITPLKTKWLGKKSIKIVLCMVNL